jgi:hypothetical protein
MSVFLALTKSIQNLLVAVFSGSINVLVALELLKRCYRPIFTIYQRLGSSGSFWLPSFCKKERQRTGLWFRVVV